MRGKNNNRKQCAIPNGSCRTYHTWEHKQRHVIAKESNKLKNTYKEHVKYFDKQIQAKLEQFPRAIEGKVPVKELNKRCVELRILKDARALLQSIN